MSIAVTVSPMGSAKSPVHASPIALGGTVLYSTLEPDCAFYRINASTGDMLWRYAAPRPATTDPSGTRCGLRACARVSTDGRHIHIGTDNNTFIMLSADRGEMVWAKPEPYAVCVDKARPVAEQNRPCEVYSTALLVGSLRIQGSEDGFVRAFREATGDLEWSVAVGAGCGGSDDLCHQVNGSPVLNPTNASEIIIGADDGFLHCLVVASGEDCGRLATCGGMDTVRPCPLPRPTSPNLKSNQPRNS
jgi:outer membrane protein assembly factor BamB